MSDYNSSLPVRTQNNGDVVINLADGTTESQLASIDTYGSMKTRIADALGDVMGSQSLSGSYWLQVVEPSNGPVTAGTAATYSTLIGGVYNSTLPTLTSGQQTALQVNSNGILLAAFEPDSMPVTQNITAQDTGSTATAQFNQTWYTGTPTTGSVASFTLSSEETVMVEISGTWTGTLQAEVSVDGGTTWVAHAIHLLSGPIFTSTFTGNVIGSINVAAKTNFRIRSTATWTGTATIKVNESLNASSIYVANALKLVDGSSSTSTTLMNIVAGTTAASTSNTAVVVGLSPNSPLPSGTNTIGIVNQGTPASLANAWSQKITDGTNGPVAVKPSTTPAAASDPSLVVGLSPNSPLPAGTNIVGKIEITDGTNVVGVAPASTAALATQPAEVVALSPNTPLPAGTNNIGSTNAQLYVSSNPVTVSNPVPVTITSASSGTPIQNFTDVPSTSFAANASFTVTYTVPATHTFSFERVWVSGSGKIKAVVQNNGTTIFTGFNSTANPNIDITVTAPPSIVAGNTVTVILTNLDKAAFDAYVTIEGNQIS